MIWGLAGFRDFWVTGLVGCKHLYIPYIRDWLTERLTATVSRILCGILAQREGGEAPNSSGDLLGFGPGIFLAQRMQRQPSTRATKNWCVQGRIHHTNFAMRVPGKGICLLMPVRTT
jgi:hypothetical protein